MSLKLSRTDSLPTLLTPLQGNPESHLARSPLGDKSTRSPREFLRELQSRKTELEMQNEMLRQTQIALRESRDHYLNLYEFASVGHLTLSNTCLITEINLTGAAMFGAERNNLINQSPDAFVVATDLDRWQSQFISAITHEAKRGFDLTLKNPDGSLRAVHFDCRRSGSDAGNLTLHVTLTDITERKRAERIVERERLRLETILKMASDGIHILNEDGLLIEANEAFLNMLGYDHTAIGHLRVTDWDAQDTSEEIKARIDRVIAQHGNIVFTTCHCRRDGTLLDVEVSASWLEIEGQGFLYAAARDITERKRYEHMLQEKNIALEMARTSAEKANLAKSEFLSSMSHELRTPLNAVIGFAQLMEAGSPPPSAAQKPKIDQILKAGWHLLALINEILDLAKIESGKVTILQESMSLADVLRDCQDMIDPQASQRGIQMTFPSFENPLYVHGDPTAVKQVMVNLLSNAIKYNQACGKVIVQCEIIGENRLRVSVEDSGIGLTPAQLAQLFQPFNRLGQEAGPEEGTGIGLVVTKQLVELMGGVVGVESRVGVGSTFWFELAVSRAPNQICADLGDARPGIPVQASKNDLLFQSTLLYVEDNPANLALVEELFAKRSDLKLLTATDGYSGIRMAHDCQPDVILMDINLPGISGFEALDILSKDQATGRIPVVALSARATRLDIEKGLQAGFLSYLTKPFKVDEFMKEIDAALRLSAKNRRLQ